MTAPGSVMLRPYQAAAASAALDAHFSGEHPVASLPTGSGKSLVIGRLAADLRQSTARPIVITVPSRELAEQNERAMHRFLPPDDVGVVCAALGRREFGRPVLIGTPQSLAGAIDRDPACVIVDECFPGGTPISTPDGERPIEQIRAGDVVGNALGNGRVIEVFQTVAKDVVRMELSDGTAVECTPGHPFFTPSGWVCAGQLERGARLYREQDLHELRGHLSPEAIPLGSLHAGEVLGEAQVLLDILLEEAREPHGESRQSGEDASDPYSDWTPAQPAGRQRDRIDEASSRVACDLGRGVDCGTGRADEAASGLRIPDQLQDRPCKPEPDDRHRIGGLHAHRPAHRARPAEGCAPGVLRVEHISRAQPSGARTVYNLHVSGHPSYFAHGVLVHNCHQMPLHHGSWFYRLFEALPRRRATPRIGLSATTFRTADGAIYGGPKSWFTCQPYQVEVGDLVAQGYLAPVRYVRPGAAMTTRGVSRSAGDFNQRELAEANAKLVDEQAEITLDALRDRRKAMVFAVTVDHAAAFRDAFRRRGEAAALIVGAMPAAERLACVEAFRSGDARVAVTVSAGLTGFDVPDVDVLACCRPTISPIIHTQSIGRGTRPAPGKAELLALDFAGNVPTFGPVHEPHFDGSGQPLGGVAPWQACGTCGTYNHFGEAACRYCGASMPTRQAVTAADLEFGTIDWAPEKRAVQGRINEAGWRRHPVESLAVHAYRKRSDPTSISCMVSLGLGGKAIVRLWFKKLHGPRWKSFWAMLLGDQPAPITLQEALARRGELIRPASVDLDEEDGFWRIVGVDYGDGEGDSEDAALVAAVP